MSCIKQWFSFFFVLLKIRVAFCSAVPWGLGNELYYLIGECEILWAAAGLLSASRSCLNPTHCAAAELWCSLCSFCFLAFSVFQLSIRLKLGSFPWALSSFGAGHSLLWGGPEHSGMCSGIPGLYSPDAGSTFSLVSPGTPNVPSAGGSEITPSENHSSKPRVKQGWCDIKEFP